MKNFKIGDICFYHAQLADYIFVFKSIGKWNIECYIGYSTFKDTIFYNPVTDSRNIEQVRLATIQEKEKLFNILSEKGLYCDEENLELINEI